MDTTPLDDTTLAVVRARLVDPEVVLEISDELFMNGFELSTEDQHRIAALAAAVLVGSLTGECPTCLKSEILDSLTEGE